jgi:hypothetical protein
MMVGTMSRQSNAAQVADQKHTLMLAKCWPRPPRRAPRRRLGHGLAMTFQPENSHSAKNLQR